MSNPTIFKSAFLSRPAPVKKTAGFWGTKSHEGDSVHDILDRYRPKGTDSELGFDEPISPDQVNRLLDEIGRYDVSLDSKDGGRGDYPGAQVYVGVVVFLVEHGSEVRPEARAKATSLAEGLLSNKADLSKWRDPEERARSLKREIALLKAGPGPKEQNAAAHGDATVTKSAAAAPRAYPVSKKKNGFWYIVGLRGEEVSEEGSETPTIKTPDTWLNVHKDAKNLDLAEQLYRELYGELQTNDNLREGDVFDTPIGQFVCDGVDVLPYDDLAKKVVAEVDESYRCGSCACDQGKHKKEIDQNGNFYYGACSDHPECQEYKRARM